MDDKWTAEKALAHHGILGQKWGKRNGPPYPLDKNRKPSSNVSTEKEKPKKVMKKAIIAGASVAGIALIAVGGVYLSNTGKLSELVKVGKKASESSLPLKLDLQYFAQPKQLASNRPFKFRNKKEAAIVTNEFRPRNMSREDMKKDILVKDINIDDQGAYKYFGKNLDGKGTFRIFKRVRIKDSATGLYERNKNNG